MADTAIEVKNLRGGSLPQSKIWIEGADITERDNASLALALGRTYPHLVDLLDREGIDDAEFLRIIYKMFAETFDGKVQKIKRKPLVKPEGRPVSSLDPKTDESDPKTETE
jgi:hypothetical protein